MNSELLSQRSKQPGHDRTFVHSEDSFISVARSILDPSAYEVVEQPPDLKDLSPGTGGEKNLGIVPEAMIKSRRTGRRFFVEVKKQGDRGNAEERACKHHTVQFYKTLNDRFGYSYHPFVTIFCEALATNPRYTRKAKYLFEAGHYLEWVDYDRDLLEEFLTKRCAEWID